MTRYVWRNGQFRDPATGEPMAMPERKGVQAPMIMNSSFEPYRSCVTGKVIDGKRARREEIAIGRDRDLVPYEPSGDRPGGLINEAFAKSGGRKTSAAAKEWAANKRKAAAVKTDGQGAIWTE